MVRKKYISSIGAYFGNTEPILTSSRNESNITNTSDCCYDDGINNGGLALMRNDKG